MRILITPSPHTQDKIGNTQFIRSRVRVRAFSVGQHPELIRDC